LKNSELTLLDIDAIVFYDKPLLKFERILENYKDTSLKGIFSFVKYIPSWLSEKLFIRKTIKEELKKIGKFDSKKLQILFSEHHLSHAASSYYPSEFKDAAILIVDGVGEFATTTIAKGKEENIEILKEIHYPDSLGLLYSSFTYFLGFKVNSGEYKLMGLAPYGRITDEESISFIKKIRAELIQINLDGSFVLNKKYFNYRWGNKMINTKKWEALFEIKKKTENDELYIVDYIDIINSMLLCIGFHQDTITEGFKEFIN
jgi:carbamoyltransferase